MMSQAGNDPKASVSRTQQELLILTLIIGAIPFSLYAWGRLIGGLPDEAAWMEQYGSDYNGNFHGPWRGEWQAPVILGYTLILWVALPLFTLGTSVNLSLKARSIAVLVKGLALIGLQLALASLQGWMIYWTID